MRSAFGEALGEVLDVLPVGPSGEPCSPGLRMGAWCRLKAMSATRRALELGRLLRLEPEVPHAHVRTTADVAGPQVSA